MDKFLEIAEQMVVYKLRTSWLMIAKLYNEMAAQHEGTMAMAFVLLAINQEKGTPVTKIAPRLGMEPNSLSRLLKSMEAKELIYRRKDELDKRKTFIQLTRLGIEKRLVAVKAVFNLEKAIVREIPAEKLTAFFEVANHIPKAIEELIDSKGEE